MSSPKRRKELAAEWAIEEAALRAEETRKDALSMWDRIEEAGASRDVKDILHRLDERMAQSVQDIEDERIRAFRARIAALYGRGGRRAT